MKTKIIEVTNLHHGGINYGKFLLGRPDVEWERRSALAEAAKAATDEVLGEGTWQDTRPATRPLLSQLGWTARHLWVLDLQTGEGALFMPGGHAANDLEKHRIWVCPLFEPMLTWLYTQDLTDLDALPNAVALEAPSEMYGYRRPGPQ